ncbi:MAG TPA: cytidylate kinase-like family protein [Verrucomicrobiota bacterium]|nr:cytidylate kinase-like family protein [Verrucomicrobiota bacterium]
MRAGKEIDRCVAFIRCHAQPSSMPGSGAGEVKLAVTISRQTGSGAWRVAERLAEFLQERVPPASCRWTVFDRELVERVLEDHNLPRELARFMPEDRVSAVEDAMQEFLGLHPPFSTLVSQTTETILKLAELGGVIVIGRGANVITSGLPHVFHVRLVGSLPSRLERVRERLGMDARSALEFLLKADRGRRRYLRDYFRAEIEDPLVYDLVVNTDRANLDDVAEMIGQAVLQRAARGLSTAPQVSAPG